MVYGAEAVMPADLEHDSPRVVHYTEATNELARQDGVDQLHEARDLARSCTAIYQQGLRRYHSRRVKTRTFQEGDLVLRLVQDKKGMHKLSPLGRDHSPSDEYSVTTPTTSSTSAGTTNSMSSDPGM